MKDYWYKKNPEGSNVISSNQKKDNNKKWEAEESIAIKEEKLALMVTILG